MDPKRLILVFFILTFGTALKGQTISFAEADSVSYSQYLKGDWKKLIGYGKIAEASGTDFPLLRQRLGYAWFMLGNYGASLNEYQKALKSDSQNQDVLAYMYLCNKYLNRWAEAAYNAAKLTDSVNSYYRIKKTGVVAAGLEASVKLPELVSRGTGSYTRAWLTAKIAPKLLLDQSLAYYSQSVSNLSNHQFEYYGRLNYPLSGHLIALGAYHYLNSSYQFTTYNDHIVLAGLRFSQPFFDVQADAIMRTLTGNKGIQANIRLAAYPAGNLNFYASAKLSFLDEPASRAVFSPVIGGRIAKNVWLEGSGSFGGLENYIDADALYVYNALDNSDYKAGVTGYLQTSGPITFTLNYSVEKKTAFNQPFVYNQHSISGGISWKF